MISILITVGPTPEDKRGPVLNAVRQNLENDQVAGVHVVTESDATWLAEAFAEHADRLHFETAESRPTFGMLMETGNRLLADGAACIGLMNADVSLPYAEDIARIHAAFDVLGEDPAPAVFAMARHEQVDGQLQIELFDGSGMPNYISADAWLFRSALESPREQFYCPGQMNCDMFFAHDLIAAGYRLFNPCYDITLVHHEPSKDDAFYKEMNEQEGTKKLMERYIEQNALQVFNYYGVPWIRAAWLEAGYRPEPLDSHNRTIVVMVNDLSELSDETLTMLASYCDQYGCQCQLLCEGDPQALFDLFGGTLARFPRILISPVHTTLQAVREAYLRGEHYGANRVTFISDLSHATHQVLSMSDFVFIGSAIVREPETERFGCTLVTSVFRSDEFLQGFINNSVALDGYDTLIDHVFLIAKVSDLEARLLNALMQAQANVVVVWSIYDPGLYACWNLGIQMARRPYISNANVDDLRDPAHVVTLIQDLEAHPEALVAATALNPFHAFPPDGTLPEDREGWYSDRPGPFTARDIGYLTEATPPRLEPFNMPHCMPVWRRSLHERFGWFDEPRYGTYADWAFWLHVLREGGYGWMNPAPLGFYYVNLESHNRRGTNLEWLHKQVEDDFIHMFLAARDNRPLHDARPKPAIEPKLQLHGQGRFFGDHRNDFDQLIRALEPAERPDGEGVLFLPFLERYFVWGSSPGEACSDTPAPITQDWIGILHVPFEAPDWFNPSVSPEVFFESEIWKASRPHCRGVITLAADLEADLKAYDPDLPTLSVFHPVEMDALMFDCAAYHARPRVVQVGDWLRKLQAIHRLRAPGHERIMLLKAYTTNYMDNEIAVFSDARDPAVDMRRMVPNDEYDALLSSSVVLCLMYNTAANNVVIECLARATPILINPLPAVVEYLGPDYPLYARDEAEADLLLALPGKVEEAHRYLLARRAEIDLSYEGFCRDIVTSGLYAGL
ncbi:MAG: hypothetical protein QNJ09_00855 [Paracoccaceae bacterium]|nr:hypothetical protein [Paracoccaceae bacterium]